MAIEGLGRLAQASNAEAVKTLLAVVAGQDRRSLRQPAAAALLIAQPDLRHQLEAMLPEDEHYLLGLREANEADLSVRVTDDDLARNPKRRQAGSKMRFPDNRAAAPTIPFRERR